MRRFLVTAVFAVALLGMLAPPVMAQAPAPEVKITGLFDQVTSGGSNFYDGNYGRTSDTEWYARTRFRPDFSFAVGRTKAVLGLEMDLTYGSTTGGDGSFGAGCGKAGSLGCLDINTDVAGIIEIKWIYTEFDLTGKDSLMPFIPVPTVARLGGQPFASLANYKVAYANGDFGGVSAVTTFSPELKNNIAFVMVEDEIAGQSRGGAPAGKTSRGEDWALILSPEITPFKGLQVKPLYSYFRADATTSGSARRTVVDRRLSGGTTTATGTYAGDFYASGDPTLHENRHTLGVDARWRSGPFGLDPTLYYQVGNRHVQTTGLGLTDARQETLMSAWLFDVIGSYQVGPFLLEVRGIYSTGNKARDNLAKSIHYFEPLDLDTSYYAGWAQILALGIDYFNGGGGANNGMATGIGYDRYGRAQIGLRGTYNVTPAFSVYGILSPTWTAQEVDTDTGQGAGFRTTVNDQSWVEGDSRYIGTEADAGFTWRFAPNTAFDLVGAWLFAGDALDTTEILNGVATKREAKDAWTVASRIRLSF